MEPGKPVGARAALDIGRSGIAVDPELGARVQLGRVRAARRIVAIDRVDDPTGDEWALGCALHDLVQANHPDFAGPLRRRSVTRLLELVDATLSRIPAPPTLADALSRHTWFARTLEITRIDTQVSSWVGSTRFKGTTPPPRLMLWPELRKVSVSQTPCALMDLPAHGGAVDVECLGAAVAGFLAKTPLTDLATCTRNRPAFTWTPAVLAMVAAPHGRTAAVRAIARLPTEAADVALGRATRALIASNAWGHARIALEVLAERALGYALGMPLGVPMGVSSGAHPASPDGAFARAAGARIARAKIASGALVLAEDDRKRALSTLERSGASLAAREVEALLASAAGNASI